MSETTINFLAVYGVIFFLILVVLTIAFIVKFVSILKRDHKSKLGTLYFKRGAYGEKAFHLSLNVELDDVREGEKYVVTVKEEKATDAELNAIREIEND